MQELVLTQAGTILEADSLREIARSRRQAEFEALLADCGRLAFRVAQGVLRNAADSEDVAQEALLRAYQNFDRLRDGARFRSWLVRIAFRLALDRWRSRKRREHRESQWAEPHQQSAPPTAADVASSNAFRIRLDKALAELPEKSRLVLILAALEGYTLAEVAEILDVPVGTVKSRLFFARKQLAEKLQ
jgi:RNA polymerase sigma-70 factor (ECF subfamily)